MSATGESAASSCSPAVAARTRDNRIPRRAPRLRPRRSTVDASRLAGKFVLHLRATSGDKQGEASGGPLELMPNDSAHRRLELPDGSSSSTYTLPLYGTTAIDFAAVGAVAPGDPESSDPASPGVLVIESPGRVLLRVGSEANRREVRRFDGAFTVLRVQQVTDDGFAGTWESGVDMDRSGGHFCATRATG